MTTTWSCGANPHRFACHAPRPEPALVVLLGWGKNPPRRLGDTPFSVVEGGQCPNGHVLRPAAPLDPDRLVVWDETRHLARVLPLAPPPLAGGSDAPRRQAGDICPDERVVLGQEHAQ
jgi:hypothetical protein